MRDCAGSLRAICVGFAVWAQLLVGVTDAQDTTEWVEAPDALSKAVMELERLCRCPITLEVPGLTGIKDEPPGFFSVLPSVVPDRASVVATLATMVQEYNAAGYPGRVRVDNTGPEVRLVPEHGSLLDKALVTLPDKEWVFVELLQEIARQIGTSIGESVRVPDPAAIGTVNGEWADLVEGRFRFSAVGERSSLVLQRLSRATGRKLSFRFKPGGSSGYGLMLGFADPHGCSSVRGKMTCYDGDGHNAVYARPIRSKGGVDLRLPD